MVFDNFFAYSLAGGVSNGDSNTGGNNGGSSTYLSDVDGGGVIGAWGIKYSQSYSGNSFTAYRSDNNTSQEIGWDGLLPSKTELTSFLNGNQGYVNTLFDSSGNSLDFSQTVNTKKPKCSDATGNLLLSDNFLALQGDGVDDSLERAVVSTQRENLSFILVVEVVSNNASGSIFMQGGAAGNGIAIGQGNSTVDASGNQLIGLHEGEEWIPTGHVLATERMIIQVIYNSQGRPSFYVNNALVFSSSATVNNTISGNNYLFGNTANTLDRYSNIKLLAILVYSEDKTANLPDIRNYLNNIFSIGVV